MSVKYTDNSKKVAEGIGDSLTRALTRIGLLAERYAKTDCPIDTGFLRNSITFALSGEEANISEYASDAGDKQGTYSGTAPNDAKKAVYIGTNVEYGANVELGTVLKGPRPFLKPAATEHKAEYKRIVEEELKKG